MNSFQKIKKIKKCSEETYIKQHEFNLLLCMCVLNSTLYEANYYYRYFLSMVEIVQYSFKYSWRGDGANVKVSTSSRLDAPARHSRNDETCTAPRHRLSWVTTSRIVMYCVILITGM